jgi:hypothetical protein
VLLLTQKLEQEPKETLKQVIGELARPVCPVEMVAAQLCHEGTRVSCFA